MIVLMKTSMTMRKMMSLMAMTQTSTCKPTSSGGKTTLTQWRKTMTRRKMMVNCLKTQMMKRQRTPMELRMMMAMTTEYIKHCKISLRYDRVI